MAGRKQHYIPQAFLRGFRILNNSNKAQVYVFKKNVAYYRTGTDGAAAERDFYSPPSDEKTLDDKITKFEEMVLSPAIVELRDGPLGEFNPEIASAVVVHLSIRTAFTRDSFTSAAMEMLCSMMDSMHNDQEARKLFEVDSPEDNAAIWIQVKEQILEIAPMLSDEDSAHLTKLAKFRVREKFSEVFQDVAEIAKPQLARMLEEIPNIVVDSHGKALEQDLAPSIRVNRLKKMNWKVIEIEGPNHLILSDCIAIGLTKPSLTDAIPYSFNNDEEFIGILMPICSKRILVGREIDFELDLLGVNKILAQCSLNFFISSNDDIESIEAAKLIGSSVSRLAEGFANEKGFIAPQKDDDSEEVHGLHNSLPKRKNFPIKFEPTGRKSTKSQQAIRRLFEEAKYSEGLNALSEVIVSDNICVSLRRRGVELNEFSERLVANGHLHISGSGSAVNNHILLPNYLVSQVARMDSKDISAKSSILYQLARLDYIAISTLKIGQETLNKPRPSLESASIHIAHFCASHYLASRQTQNAITPDEDFKIIDYLFAKDLNDCELAVSEVRGQNLEQKNVDLLIHSMLSQAQQLLVTASIFCARGGTSSLMLEGSKSNAALQDFSLSDWIHLFERDLSNHFESFKGMSGDGELILLGSHVERVLSSYGVMLSAKIPEKIWIKVLSEDELIPIRKLFKN